MGAASKSLDPVTVEGADGHTLKARFIKDRDRWEGECSCDRFAGQSPKAAGVDPIVSNFDLHITRQRR